MSSGGTASLLHSHADENIHCVLAGRKDFILIHQKELDKSNLEVEEEVGFTMSPHIIHKNFLIPIYNMFFTIILQKGSHTNLQNVLRMYLQKGVSCQFTKCSSHVIYKKVSHANLQNVLHIYLQKCFS